MNIQNRLRKLEDKTKVSEVYCQCGGSQGYEMLLADLSVESDTAEPEAPRNVVPDTCPQCRKPVQKKQIILQLCDQTTRNRFPEEWNSYNQ